MLMCLAEALLRIPDGETRDRLIRDKLGVGDWARHLGHSGSLFVNASTWGLMLTGRFVRVDLGREGEIGPRLARLVQRLGEPVVRQAILQSMRVLGRHFVLGQTIAAAIRRAREPEQKGYRYSYDMLGEAARTMADAERYQRAYGAAIAAIVEAARGDELMARARHLDQAVGAAPALRDRAAPPPGGRAAAARLASCSSRRAPATSRSPSMPRRASGSSRRSICSSGSPAPPSSRGWDGLGLAVQAYQKRAIHVIAWLEDLARRQRRRIPVRLVKGAYWDSEIKRAQELGLDGYPVFTRKLATDVSYLACARRLLAGGEAFYPQFATHNAQTLASIVESAGRRGGFEFQRLHGMGEALYEGLAQPRCAGDPLPGLRPGRQPSGPAALPGPAPARERRQHLVRQPHPRPERPDRAAGGGPGAAARAHRAQAQPADSAAGGALRRRADGTRAASISPTRQRSRRWPSAWPPTSRRIASLGPGGNGAGRAGRATIPADRTRVVGSVIEAEPADCRSRARRGRDAAFTTGPAARSSCAPARSSRRPTCTRRMPPSCWRCACARPARPWSMPSPSCARRWISCATTPSEARSELPPRDLPGPTGESNRIALHGRGVFAAISPWNFPLAIFTGQVAAALVAGNAVVAKPAPQTPLIAARAVELLHEAGVPAEVLVLLPGGPEVGARLVASPGLAGVAFTGSTATARRINQALAASEGPIPVLIAETGGQNAMLVDSSALVEQVVADVVLSAFRSAGQRCSALRVLFLQDDSRSPRARDAGRRDGGAAGRRPGPPGHRRRPGDRRAGARASRPSRPRAWRPRRG